jgi:hypothetical protein
MRFAANKARSPSTGTQKAIACVGLCQTKNKEKQMKLDELTLGEVKQLKAIFSDLPNVQTETWGI